MAVFDHYIDELLKSEGGFVDHPNDPGGATNKGITLANWRRYGKDLDGDGDIDIKDLKAITPEEANAFYKNRFWDKMKGDGFVSQAVANIVFDMFVNSGNNGIKLLQRVLNQMGESLTVDGIMGPKTLAATNRADPDTLHDQYKEARINYYRSLAASRPKLKVFLKGWLNRVAKFPWKKKSIERTYCRLCLWSYISTIKKWQKKKLGTLPNVLMNRR